jgi:hypothetical protein
MLRATYYMLNHFNSKFGSLVRPEGPICLAEKAIAV